MKPLALLSLVIAAGGLLLAASPASAQATRTWVSGVGDDVNPCSRTAPCKTFAGAISKTAPGGEISVLDPGGFGAVTITKSISINGEWGGEAGVLVSGTNGIVINAAATDTVNLRGLMLEGAKSGLNGIRVIQAAEVHVQDLVIHGFNGANGTGILVNPSAGTVNLNVVDTLIEDNGSAGGTGGGVLIQPTGATTVNATFERVQVNSNQGFGIRFDGDLSTGAVNGTVRDSETNGNVGAGIFAISPNNGDAPVVVAANNVVSSNNTGAQGNGFRSIGQKATLRVGFSVASGNASNGLLGSNSGVLGTYGNNMTDGNGVANAGTSPATLT